MADWIDIRPTDTQMGLIRKIHELFQKEQAKPLDVLYLSAYLVNEVLYLLQVQRIEDDLNENRKPGSDCLHSE